MYTYIYIYIYTDCKKIKTFCFDQKLLTIFGLGLFWGKVNHTWKIYKYFWIVQSFQNASMLSVIYYWRASKAFSVRVGCNYFFSCCEKHQLHHLLRCHATGFNFSFIFTFKNIAFFLLVMPRQKSGMNNTIRIIFIKSIIVIKVSFIVIHSKDTQLISIKFDFTKIFIKKENIIIITTRIMKIFKHCTCNKSIRNKFWCC